MRSALLAALLAGLFVAPPALGAAIAGATYHGTGADGANVTFTVSSDGTIVDSYLITGIKTSTCSFLGSGEQGVWQGAPIATDAFDYEFYDAISFRGTFDGRQSASGTFRFYDPATASTPACDTREVQWTAKTTATPPNTGTPGGGTPGGGTKGGGTPGGGSKSSHRKPTFATRIRLRQRSRTLVAGQIRSANRGCIARRQIILWRGRRKLATTRSNADGTFTFRRSAKVRGHLVRASATAALIRAGTCAAGSSTFVDM